MIRSIELTTLTKEQCQYIIVFNRGTQGSQQGTFKEEGPQRDFIYCHQLKMVINFILPPKQSNYSPKNTVLFIELKKLISTNFYNQSIKNYKFSTLISYNQRPSSIRQNDFCRSRFILFKVLGSLVEVRFTHQIEFKKLQC